MVPPYCAVSVPFYCFHEIIGRVTDITYMFGLDCENRKSDLNKYSNGANLIGFPRTEHFTIDERKAFKFANDS